MQQETCDSGTFQSKQPFSVNSPTKSDLTIYNTYEIRVCDPLIQQ